MKGKIGKTALKKKKKEVKTALVNKTHTHTALMVSLKRQSYRCQRTAKSCVLKGNVHLKSHRQNTALAERCGNSSGVRENSVE